MCVCVYVCAYRSVGTCLSLCFGVAELSGGPGSYISPQDFATVLISKLFFCVAAFVVFLSSAFINERVNGLPKLQGGITQPLLSLQL